MFLWRLFPVAQSADPRWQGRSLWREVIVNAPSAAMARVYAARMEEGLLQPSTLGNESLRFRSGFEDEKLYWVARLTPEEVCARGAAGEGRGAIRKAARAE